ncbi:hypothetical protein LZ31DRAFT_608068 [Colletotrichum somersetense]|nr:hypothetical protein LZ31DRAFT_608068 [Colletotrichum somersetense]
MPVQAPILGLTCDNVNLGFLKHFMKGYDSNEEEWRDLALADHTRNLVNEGNRKSNLPQLMKIFKGELTETRYDYPKSHKGLDTTVGKSDRRHMDVMAESIYTANEVAYISDDLGVHKIWNKDNDFAISLHLYTSPNTVRDGCYMFDAGTGKDTLIKRCEIYSIRGSLVKTANGQSVR